MNKIDFKESENFSSLIYLLENLGRDEIKKFLGIQENGTSEALRFLLEKNEMLPLIIQKDDHDRLTPFIDFIAKVEEKVREIAPKEIQLAEESAPKRARTDGGLEHVGVGGASRNDSSNPNPSPSRTAIAPDRDSSTQPSSSSSRGQ